MDYTFDYKTLPLELRDKIALESNYKDLLNLCKTSKEAFGEICESNGFWKKKTFYDFGDLYDIEEFEGNWWDTYQYYRSVFTLDLIKTIKNQEPLLAEGLLRINEERGFLMVDGYDDREDTALILASSAGYTAIVEMLLNARADPNLANVNGYTALIKASNEGHTDIVEMLLNAGAKLNLETRGGGTALMFASNGHTAIVEMLLNAGANPNLTDEYGMTALDLASLWDHTDIVRILKRVTKS